MKGAAILFLCSTLLLTACRNEETSSLENQRLKAEIAELEEKLAAADAQHQQAVEEWKNTARQQGWTIDAIQLKSTTNAKIAEQVEAYLRQRGRTYKEEMDLYRQVTHRDFVQPHEITEEEWARDAQLKKSIEDRYEDYQAIKAILETAKREDTLKDNPALAE